MPENQSQSNLSGTPHPQGSPAPQQPDAPSPERPSDQAAAHAPQEGRLWEAEGVSPPHTDPEAARAEGSGKDRRENYGHSPSGHSRPGTDSKSAGAAFADRMPEASRTPARDEGEA